MTGIISEFMWEETVICCNLTGLKAAIKHALSYLGLVVLVGGMAAGLGCSKDLTTAVDASWDYSGTYVATLAIESIDGETSYKYGGSNITGLMVIQDTAYALQVVFAYGSNYFGRSDNGTLQAYDGYVDFAPAVDTVLQSTARGTYDPSKQEITISYIRDDVLWTEYWKSVTQVVNPDTTTYMPF